MAHLSETGHIVLHLNCTKFVAEKVKKKESNKNSGKSIQKEMCVVHTVEIYLRFLLKTILYNNKNHIWTENKISMLEVI